MQPLKTLAEHIANASTIVVLTGAGMSTESGIPDFRSESGLYTHESNVEYYLSEDYFHKEPVDFWIRFKRMFSLKMMGNFEPNKGHLFLRDLENLGKQVVILTQNIDGLHQKAGSKNVIELHGTLQTATCQKCETKYDLQYLNVHDVPCCTECGDILKPDVVLFGGIVPKLDEAFDWAADSDLLIAMGTSLEVTPVNQIPLYAGIESPKVIKAIINKSSTRMDYIFDLVIHEAIGDTVVKLRSYL